MMIFYYYVFTLKSKKIFLQNKELWYSVWNDEINYAQQDRNKNLGFADENTDWPKTNSLF